jgi:hypothetical protein
MIRQSKRLDRTDAAGAEPLGVHDAEEGGAKIGVARDRSTKVEFPSFDLDVDAVRACPADGHWSAGS